MRNRRIPVLQLHFQGRRRKGNSPESPAPLSDPENDAHAPKEGGGAFPNASAQFCRTRHKGHCLCGSPKISRSCWYFPVSATCCLLSFELIIDFAGREKGPAWSLSPPPRPRPRRGLGWLYFPLLLSVSSLSVSVGLSSPSLVGHDSSFCRQMALARKSCCSIVRCAS